MLEMTLTLTILAVIVIGTIWHTRNRHAIQRGTGMFTRNHKD